MLCPVTHVLVTACKLGALSGKLIANMSLRNYKKLNATTGAECMSDVHESAIGAKPNIKQDRETLIQKVLHMPTISLTR